MIPVLPTIRRAAAVLLVCSSISLAACTSSDSGGGATTTKAPKPVEVGAVLQGIADDVIVPSYEALGSGLDGLEAATGELCASPSEANLVAAQDAWREAATAYQGTRAAGVGPALDARLMSDIGFAARERVISLLLESGDPVDVAAMEQEGSAARGLYAAEIALFGEGTEALTSAAGARRCEYAASVSTLMVQAAAPVIEQWTSGDAGEQLVEGLDGGPQSSVAALVNEATQRLTEIDGMGLRDMAAASGVEDLDASRVGGPADQRLAERKALLAGISALTGDGSDGISALVGAKDANAADRLVDAQAKADETLAALPDAVADAFDDPKAIDAASKAVDELKVLLSTEVATKLGVTITFSDSDGDS
ncbi:MAG: Peptidase Imelysin [Ilumatobacteraceae bacterium]|nr:Peptidase Imelysin [Ilumatobacteraceae bacterium]